MSFLPTGVCVIGLLSLFLLGRSLYSLRTHQTELLRLTGTTRLQSVMAGLLAGPILAILGLTILFIFVLTDQFFLRITHGIFILGVWMVLTLAFANMLLVTRLGERPSPTILAAAVLSVPLVAYLTPLERFAEVFNGYNLLVPMATGAILVVVCYSLILYARYVLLHPSS